LDTLIRQFVIFWTVIDPIGTIPIFLAVTAPLASAARARSVALQATAISAVVLIFFVIAGEILLEAMAIPLAAFQVAGGIVLFLFALSMIFGSSKPEEELLLVEKGAHDAVYPLAIPSIASPGAMMAAVLLTDNHRFSIVDQALTTLTMLLVLAITLVLMYLATRIQKVLGQSGASVISRIMGLILASVAVDHVLSGLLTYFERG
jgi:multiple antibiotic resistance protein